MNRVRELREAAGLSREKLARLADVSFRTIEKVEGGNDLRLSTAKALADALGVSVENLFPEPEEATA